MIEAEHNATHLVEEALCGYLPDDATALLSPLSFSVLPTRLNVPVLLAVGRALLENTQVGGCATISAWIQG